MDGALDPGRTSGRPPCWCASVAVALVVLVGLLGPSPAVPPLGRTGDGSAWVVEAALLAAVALGVVAVLRGLRSGTAPRRAPAVAAAAVLAMVLVAPVGNADLLSYAAYGRIAATGADPYAVPPQPSADPVRAAVEDPWRATPSVYGPLGTLEQAAVLRLTGDRLVPAVRLLAGVNGLLFWLTGLLLWRRAGPRGFWLWWGNPLLLLELVAGAHLDTAVALAVLVAAAPPAVRAGRSAAGLAAAAGTAAALAVKATAAWGVLGLLRHRPATCVLGAAVAAAGYLAAGPHVLDQARVAGRAVSAGTPWRPVASGLELVLPGSAARLLVSAAAVVLALAGWRRLEAVLPAAADARWSGGVPASPPAAGTPAAVRGALAASLAWLLLSPYGLPWYAATVTALLTLSAPSRLDRWVTAWTAVFAVAYLPGRVVPLPAGLHAAVVGWRAVVCPLVTLAVLAAALRRPEAAVARRAGAAGQRAAVDQPDPPA